MVTGPLLFVVVLCMWSICTVAYRGTKPLIIGERKLLNTNSQSYDVALWRRLAFQHSIPGSLLLPGWFVNVSDSRMFGLGIQGVWDCWGPVFRGADCDIIKRNVVSVLFEGFQFSPLRPSRQCSCASSVLSVWWLVVPTRSTATNGRGIWGKPKPFRNLNLFLLTCYDKVLWWH